MEELCEEICLSFEEGPIDLKMVAIQVAHLSKILSKTTSKFIDIDPSLKENTIQVQQVRNNLFVSVQNRELQSHLFDLYELLKTYVGLKVKYGEAADWYLKNEFGYREEEMNKALGRALFE